MHSIPTPNLAAHASLRSVSRLAALAESNDNMRLEVLDLATRLLLVAEIGITIARDTDRGDQEKRILALINRSNIDLR